MGDRRADSPCAGCRSEANYYRHRRQRDERRRRRDGAGAGAKLLTKDNQQIAAGGRALESLARIDVSELDKRLAGCRIDVACDVTNPLTGPQGATAVFGPQKGATAEMIPCLDNALAHFADIIHRDLELDVLHLEGGGAAGEWARACTPFAAQSCGRALRL